MANRYGAALTLIALIRFSTSEWRLDSELEIELQFATLSPALIFKTILRSYALLNETRATLRLRCAESLELLVASEFDINVSYEFIIIRDCIGQ